MQGLPFPEASPRHAESSTSEQLLLRKEVAQRFGHSGTYRDVPFAVRHFTVKGLSGQGSAATADRPAGLPVSPPRPFPAASGVATPPGSFQGWNPAHSAKRPHHRPATTDQPPQT